jgi:hypothetical protein
MVCCFKTELRERGDAMNDLIAKYRDQLSEVLPGCDRLVFRGALWKDRRTGGSGSCASIRGLTEDAIRE